MGNLNAPAGRAGASLTITSSCEACLRYFLMFMRVCVFVCASSSVCPIWFIEPGEVRGEWTSSWAGGSGWDTWPTLHYTTLSTQSSPPPSSSQEPGEGGGGGFLSCSCRMERETKDQLGPRWCPVMRISQRRSGGDAMWYPLSFTNQGDCLHSLPKCKCICEHNFTKRDLIVSEVISLWN